MEKFIVNKFKSVCQPPKNNLHIEKITFQLLISSSQQVSGLFRSTMGHFHLERICKINWERALQSEKFLPNLKTILGIFFHILQKVKRPQKEKMNSNHKSFFQRIYIIFEATKCRKSKLNNNFCLLCIYHPESFCQLQIISGNHVPVFHRFLHLC